MIDVMFGVETLVGPRSFDGSPDASTEKKRDSGFILN